MKNRAPNISKFGHFFRASHQIRSFGVASSAHSTNCTVQFSPILRYKFSTDHDGLHTWACWPAKIVGHVRKGSPFIFLFSLVYTRKTTRPGNVQHKFPAHWKGLLLITLPFCTLCSVFQAWLFCLQISVMDSQFSRGTSNIGVCSIMQ